MSRRVLIAGHWAGARAPMPSSRTALEAVARGFASRRPDWEVALLPFGAGAAFEEALPDEAMRARAVSIAVDEPSTLRAGGRAREILEGGATPIVEGANVRSPDAGIGFLAGFTGRPLPPAALPLAERLEAVAQLIAEGERALAKRDLIAAASTSRPLLGLDSVLAVDVDLEARPYQDRDLSLVLARLLARAPSRSLPLLDASSEAAAPGRMPGSGLGGGAGAMIAAIGGRIVDAAAFLAASAPLSDAVEGCDLALVLEPDLHSPRLAEAMLDTLTRAASQAAIPVVGVGESSSLSGHERAEWGLHGQFVTEGRVDLEEAGSRIARTWTR